MASQGKRLLPGPTQGLEGGGAVLVGLQEGGGLLGDLLDIWREGGASTGPGRRREHFGTGGSVVGREDCSFHHAPGRNLARLCGRAQQLRSLG